MRLLFINYEFPPLGGGGSNANLHLFHEFSNIPDLQIDCVTSAPGEEQEVVDFSSNIRLYRLPVGKRDIHYWRQSEILRFLWKARRTVVDLLAREPYDLCHAFFGFPSGLIPWINRSKIPYLVSLRGSDVPGFNPRLGLEYRLLTPLFRAIWSGASGVIANSEGLKELATRSWQGPIGVIPNGVDTDAFSPGDVGSGTRLLCVSRLVGRKGVRHLVEAMPLVRDRIAGAHLTIVGSGKEEDVLRHLADSLGVSGCIRFAGALPHGSLPALYGQADLYVQPSFYEGMSNTILEAMASGLPIVTSAEGGVEELLLGNARRVPYGDASRLAETIIELLGDQESLRRMGEQSRTIAEQFSWKSVADAYLSKYQSIMRGNS